MNGSRFALAIFLSACLLVIPGNALAQNISIDLGNEATLSGRVIQLFLLVTLLSLAPAIAIMITCFPFMVTVLSLLRQGIGLQAAPPNMLIISLAMFLTYFVIEPGFNEAVLTKFQTLRFGDFLPPPTEYCIMQIVVR